MKLTDRLLGEHATFQALLNEIENMASVAGDVAKVDSAMTVLTTEVKSHATLEEKLLFPALGSYAQAAGLLDEMRSDHRKIEAGLRNIEDAQDLNEALTAVNESLDIARNHFKKEEELYAMAEEVLDEESFAQLGEAWAAAHSA